MLVLEGKLTCVRIPSWCNVLDGDVVVPLRKKTCASFHSPCNVVVRNSLVLVLEIILTCISFPSLCNVVVINARMLVPERKLTCYISFMMQCISWKCGCTGKRGNTC